MKVKYFAWVRERIGKAEETIEPPPSVRTVDDLIAWLARTRRDLRPRLRDAARDPRRDRPCPRQIRCRDRRRPRDRLLPADDRRLIPVMAAAVTIRIQQADFDIGREIAALTKGRTDIGAVVSFSGICRGSEGDDAIAALTLEHYPGMAEAEIARHAETATARWPLTGVTVDPSRRPHHARRKYRAGADGVGAPAGGIPGGGVPDGLFEGQRAVLETRGRRRRNRLGRRAQPRRRRLPRAGPNPDGRNAQNRRRSGRPHPRNFQKSHPANCRRCSISCAMRSAVSSKPNWCSRMAPPIRWPRPPSWSAKRCTCIPTSSRPLPPRG